MLSTYLPPFPSLLGAIPLFLPFNHRQYARYFARTVGIEDVHARVLPAEKAAMIRQFISSSPGRHTGQNSV
jgi:hypothetical protein